MQKYFIALLWMALFSCGNAEEKKEAPASPNTTETTDSKQREDAANWLTRSIEQYFTQFDSLQGDYSAICTKDYAECKGDASAVGMDGGLSDEEFSAKWKNRDLSQIGIGEGFLVGGNDFGTIRVRSCRFKNKTAKGAIVFETVLEDLDFKSTFYREIAVIPQGESFLIEDIKETRNVFSTTQ